MTPFSGNLPVAFIYGARETLWPGVVQSLLAESGVAADSLRRCSACARNRLGWSLEEVSNDDVHPPEHAREPILTAIQIALTDCLRDNGVRPVAVGARSAGEFAAAYARGAISWENAMEIACRVGRLIQDNVGTGCMIAVRRASTEMEARRAESPVAFSVAADDPIGTSVIVCELDDLARLETYLDSIAATYKVFQTNMAFHSAGVEAWRQSLIAPLGANLPARPAIPGYSSATGGPIDDAILPAEQFWNAMRAPAMMAPALRRMLADGYRVFLEIGGQPSLAPMIEELAKEFGANVVVTRAMRRRVPFSRTLADALESLEATRMAACS